MADTRVQLEVEDWVRESWMKEHLAEPFFRRRVKLSSGGVFDFDAVNGDGSVVACISTSGGRTSSGKNAVGKLHKIRADMLFLLMAGAVQRRLVIFTEQDMFTVLEKERQGGRVPRSIEFLVAEIPGELRARLVAARKAASEEVGSAAAEQLPDEVLLRSKEKIGR